MSVFPVYWMISRSFLPRNRIRSDEQTWFPLDGTLGQLRPDPRRADGFRNALVTSLSVTLLTVVVALLFAFLAAVAVSRFRFRGRKSFILTLLLIQMIPAEGLFISQYKMLEGVSLLNSVFGLTFVYVASVLPFTVWTLRGFVDGVPRELEEAAMMDGCSRVQAFFTVTLPLLAPGPGRDRAVRVHPGLERVHARAGRDDRPGQGDAAGLAGRVLRVAEPWRRLGRDHGRVDADHDPGHRVLPDRPAPDGLRAHRGRGEGMSLESDALGVLLPSFRGPALPPDVGGLLEEGLGGICLFGSNLTGSAGDVRALTDAVRRARPDALVAVDEEGGDVTRLHTRTGSPVLGAAQLGAIDDLALTAAAGRAVAADLAAAGIDLDLGPVADVNSNPDNPVIGTRSFGSDPELVGRHVAAWVGGLQAGGVAACVKHFPGHGATAQDSHLTLPVLDAPADVVRSRDLPPFAAAVDAGVAAVMTSHISVPALDPDLPATLSAPILTALREELGFDGAIVSDALDMAGASAGRGIPTAAVLALSAGADLLCVGPDKDASLVREIQRAIVDAVRSGRLTEERLTDAAARVDGVRGFRGLETVASATSSTSGGTDHARRPRPTARSSSRASCPISPARGSSASTPRPTSRSAKCRGASARTGRRTPVGSCRAARSWCRSATPTGAPRCSRCSPALPDSCRRRRVGLAGASRLRRGPRICTRGSSRPTVAAVEEILRKAGWAMRPVEKARASGSTSARPRPTAWPRPRTGWCSPRSSRPPPPAATTSSPSRRASSRSCGPASVTRSTASSASASPVWSTPPAGRSSTR